MAGDDEEGGGRFATPTTRRQRFTKLAGMTASVAANYAKNRLSTAFKNAEDSAIDRALHYAQSGERIAQTLGELKGAAMKIGQMASVAQDVLPKELAQALTKLQKEAPPMPFEVIAGQIERELGSRPEHLFSQFAREPFAAASIGQVHRARTDDGREVVVKIQYPGVDESVDSDLAHLKLALRASGLLRLSKDNVNVLFAEIRARLREELDYTNEADNVRAFRKFHAHQPFIAVPEVVGERSSQRILTLTYVPGDNINELDAKGYSQEARDLIGLHLFQLFLEQMFRFGAIHADPNPANFAFRPDGSLVVYDFGCVKKLKPEIVKAYASTILAGIEERYEAVEAGLLALGARNPAGPPVELEYYKEWRDVILLPFARPEPFDYGSSTVHEEVVKRVPTILKRIASFQPPVEVVFIDRVIGGHYGNLRKIRSRGKFLDLIMPYLRAGARGEPPELAPA